MDKAVNSETGDVIFMIAQSYMPAQEIHILVNPANSKLSPWYELNFEAKLKTPQWEFNKEDLRTF